MSLFSKETQLMTEGSISRHIIKFAIPLLIGNILQQSYQLVDMVIVGRCIDDGGLSIAAVGVSSSFIGMMIGLFMGLSTGAGIVISNAYGAGKTRRVKQSIRLSLWVALGFALLLTVFSVFCCDWILELINTTDDIFDLASTYLTLYCLGFVPLLVYNMGTAILQALGNSTSPFYYLAITCVLNVVLDLVFVQGLEMGVGGAAIATVISKCIATALVLRKILTSGVMKAYGEKVLKEKATASNGRLLGLILKFGVPIAIQSVTMSMSNMVLQGNINLLGTSVIAAWSIFGKIDGYILLPTVSFRMAITTFTGQNYGAKRLDRVKEGKRVVSLMSVGTTVGLGALALLLCEPLVRLFDDSPEILDICWEMALYMIPFYFTLALIHVYTGLFNGLGKPVFGSAAMIICMCFIRVACVAVAFPILESTLAIYLAYYASWFSCLFILMGEYHFILKKQLGLN